MSQRPATSGRSSPRRSEDKPRSRDRKCDCSKRKNDWGKLATDCKNRVWRSGNTAWSRGDKAWRAGKRAWTAGDKAWESGERVLHKIGGECGCNEKDFSGERNDEQYSNTWIGEENFLEKTGKESCCETIGCFEDSEDEQEHLRFKEKIVRENQVEECPCDRKSPLGNRNVGPRFSPYDSREKPLYRTENESCSKTRGCFGVRGDERERQFINKEGNIVNNTKEEYACGCKNVPNARKNEPDSRAWTRGEILQEKSTCPCDEKRGLSERNVDPNLKIWASGEKFLDNTEKECHCKAKSSCVSKKHEREFQIQINVDSFTKKSEDQRGGRNIEQHSKAWTSGQTDTEACCKILGCTVTRKNERKLNIQLNGDNVLDNSDEQCQCDRKIGSGERNVEPRSNPWAGAEQNLNKTGKESCCRTGCSSVTEDEREYQVRIRDEKIESKQTKDCVCGRKNVSDGRKGAGSWARAEKVPENSAKERCLNTCSVGRKDERRTMRFVGDSGGKRSEPKQYATKRHKDTCPCAVKNPFKKGTGGFIRNLGIAEKVGRETRKASQILENERKLQRNRMRDKCGGTRVSTCNPYVGRGVSENRQDDRRKNWSSSAEYWTKIETKPSSEKTCPCG